MKQKTITAIIEASKTGYNIYVENEDLPLTSYGKTIAEAKADLHDVLQTMIAFYQDKGQPLPAAYNKGKLAFVFRYDIASIFNHFGMLDAGGLAKKIGMNASLLRQYKTGKALASDKQKERIEKGLHELGHELLSIRL